MRELNLRKTSVSGDIRDIGERDFLALEVLTLPKGVYGGSGREFQLISDVPDVMNTLYSFRKQRGFQQPPTEEEYSRILSELED